MSGMAQLQECMTLVLSKLDGIEQKMTGARTVEDMTAPLSAEALCERWKIKAPSRALRLTYLARKCQAWGLRPLAGTRGESAMYGRDAVVHAESFASGKINRRRNAR